MKKLALFIFVTFTLISCNKKETKTDQQAAEKAFKKSLQYEELQSIINKKDDVLYVVNFWATWCVPCVQEIPDFMEVNKKFAENKNYKMLLVSLDKASEVESKVKPFLIKKNIVTDVYVLDDAKRMNEWIPKFDENWDGAIPTTILYKNGEKVAFKGQQLNKTELQNLIEKHL